MKTSNLGYANRGDQCRVPAGSSTGGQFSSCKARTEAGFGFKDGEWLGTDGKKVSAEDADRLKALRVPRNWTNVHLNPDKAAAMQAVGLNPAGKTQRIYSNTHTDTAASKKFARVKEFHEDMPKIRRQLNKDLDSQDPRTRETAQVLYLVYKSGFRIGSDTETGAKEQAYGASTLTGRHVSVSGGNRTSFDFIGKKGVKITKTITDKTLAEFMAAKIRTLRANDPVFSTTDSQARAYLKRITGKDYKVKDFRTWNGTQRALAELNKYSAPKTAKEARSIKTAVAKAVADHLGNTPDVAVKSYIAPEVWGKLEIL